MSIHEKSQEVKAKFMGFHEAYGRDILIILSICLACTLGYGIGLMNRDKGHEKPVISTFSLPVANKGAMQNTTSLAAAKEDSVRNTDTVYASKSGTRYYYATCSGLSRIKLANKVSYATAAVAEAKGLTLAANCHP